MAFLGYFLGISLFPKRYPLVFYKFFGITVFMLLLWYTSMFTGIGWVELIPYVFAAILAASVVLAYFFRDRIRVPSRAFIKEFIGVELISLVVFAFLVFVRTFKTDILGTEKLMDVALINTIAMQNHLPIENPWLSGFYMNYYYFGHFILAVFQYLFAVPSAIGYNLAISLYGVWILQAGYMLAKVLRLNKMQSLLTAFILTFGGNFYLLVQTLIQGGKGSQWFASATRVIPFTINEFPAYSVILGDLHGHYLAYPFFLLGAFLLVDIFFPEKEGQKENIVAKSTFLGILLGHLYLTNSWDVLSLALMGAVIVGGFAYKLWLETKDQQRILDWGKEMLLYIALPIGLLSIPQFLSSRSYYLPPVGGIGFNVVYSGLPELFMLFGQFVVFGGIGLAALFYIIRHTKLVRKWKNPTFVLPVLFMVLGGMLALAVEFFYAKDVFSILNPPYARTNTVFKIYFHVWAFWSIGTMALFMSTMKVLIPTVRKNNWILPAQLLVIVALGVMASYPYIAIKQYLAPKADTLLSSRLVDPKMSDGYSFIQSLHTPDYDLIQYLMKKPYSRILEIINYDSYSYNARISSYTGHTTVTGWPLHNVQWYNGYDGKGITVSTKQRELIDVATRVTDVEKMYTSKDETEVENLLKKYSIQYVIFGDQEKVWADNGSKVLNQQVYDNLCKIDWQQNNATVYDCQ
jgi:uncharacterized membrane protein